MRTAIFFRMKEFMLSSNSALEIYMSKARSDFESGKSKVVNLNEFVNRTLKSAIFHSIIGSEASSEFKRALKQLAGVSMNYCFATYFLPCRLMRWIIKFTIDPRREEVFRCLQYAHQ
jgi:hypothetical protein